MGRQLATRLTRLLTAGSMAALLVLTPAGGQAATVVGPGGGTPDTSLAFQLVGHNALVNRGENAAIAIFDHFSTSVTAATARTRAAISIVLGLSLPS